MAYPSTISQLSRHCTFLRTEARKLREQPSTRLDDLRVIRLEATASLIQQYLRFKETNPYNLSYFQFVSKGRMSRDALQPEPPILVMEDL